MNVVFKTASSNACLAEPAAATHGVGILCLYSFLHASKAQRVGILRLNRLREKYPGKASEVEKGYRKRQTFKKKKKSSENFNVYTVRT